MNRQQHEQQASEKTETSPRKKIWLLKKLMMLKNKKMKLRSLQVVLASSPFRWKRVKDTHHSFFDNVVFKIVSVCEGVVLVSAVCLFFLCCGCHF